MAYSDEEPHKRKRSKVYYGEGPCGATYQSGAACRNGGYYVQPTDRTRPLCGVHSVKETREKLGKNPNARAIAIERESQRRQAADAARNENCANNRGGQVVMQKMQMRAETPHVDGYLMIKPNKNDGEYSALSPFKLGPVDHNYEDVPAAKTLEGFHQGNKMFDQDVDADGNPTASGLEARNRFLVAEPRRHKYKRGMKPLYSLHGSDDRRLNYLETRVIYCVWYVRLAEATPEWATLRALHRSGYNLAICGYDSFPVIRDIYDHFLDLTKPFGHEATLYAMLTVKGEKPWERYLRENPEVYEGLLSVAC